MDTEMNIAPIKVEVPKLDDSGATVTIPLFTLLQWKYALKLEKRGMKMSRGSLATHVRKVLGVPRYPIHLLHQYIIDTIDDVNNQLGVPNE